MQAFCSRATDSLAHDTPPLQSPLLLTLFTTILPSSTAWASVLWTAIDALAAGALVSVYRSRQRVSKSSRDWLIASLYLLNPYLLFPSIALSTTSIENALIVFSLMFAAQGKSSPALLTAAFLLHIALPSLLFVAPLILLLSGTPTSQLASPHKVTVNFRQVGSLALELAMYFAILFVASCLAVGGFQWIPQTWGMNLTFEDLTPNPGMWWYFFTEMFDYFRPFFLMVFSMHLLIYIAPICIKFQYDPLFACFVLTGVMSTFSPYPTLGNMGLFLTLLSIFPEIFPHLRYPIVTTLLHLHASLLMPLFYHLWVGTGTGNANFYYATTLVFACANGAALLDVIWAGLRIAIGPQVDQVYTVVQE